MKPEEMAEWLCNTIADCARCPYDDNCWTGCNGALYWLTEEEWEVS